MKNLIFAVMMCLLVVTATYSNACVMVNAGDHWELNGTCTEAERDVMVKEAIRSAPTMRIVENNIIKPRQKKSGFYKVIGKDIRLRKDKITGWQLHEDWYKLHEDKGKPCECGTMSSTYINKMSRCKWIDWQFEAGCYKWTTAVCGSYQGKWYILYVGKDKQDAINWLDRQAP